MLHHCSIHIFKRTIFGKSPISSKVEFMSMSWFVIDFISSLLIDEPLESQTGRYRVWQFLTQRSTCQRSTSLEYMMLCLGSLHILVSKALRQLRSITRNTPTNTSHHGYVCTHNQGFKYIDIQVACLWYRYLCFCSSFGFKKHKVLVDNSF